MTNIDKMKRKWIAQMLAMVMILSMALTTVQPQYVFAETFDETQNVVPEDSIATDVATGSAILPSDPNEPSMPDPNVPSIPDPNEPSMPAPNEFSALATEKDLFFSEYIEGTSNNKAIEIYNGTGVDVNLADYSVLLYSNGATTATNTSTLTGTILAGDVYILYNSSASDPIKLVGDLSSGVANFNGDDALELRKSNVVIDVFGKVGEDPGTYWSEGDLKTQDKTLVRKSLVNKGNTTFSLGEWDQYNIDTFTNLGSHTMTDGTVNNNVAAVVGNPVSGSILYNTNDITLSCATEEATISYRFSATDEWSVYTDKLTLAATDNRATVFVKAEAAGKIPSEATLEYTVYSDSNLVSIATARAGSNGTGYLVKGVVTFLDGGKSAYLQDVSGGIVARFAVNQTFIPGDEIIVYGTSSTYNGLLQLNSSVLLRGAVATTLPEPTVLTLNEVASNSEIYEAQLVRINNVILGDINTGGNTIITDGTYTMNLYKMPLPSTVRSGDTVDVIAIMSQYSATGTGGYQLRVVNAADIIWIKSPAVAVVTASPSGGEVLSGTIIQLSCETVGATIWYKQNGGEATEYTAPFAITENTIIEAYATKNSTEGTKNTFTYKIGDGKTDILEARAIFSDPTVLDKKATITGIVTFIDGSNVFMQDGSAGIDVYFSGGTVSSKPADLIIGKELTVTGELAEYKGLLEITKLTEATVGETKPLPEPRLINLNTVDAVGLEVVESQRILIEGVTLGTINLSGDTVISSSEGKTLNLYKMPALTGIVAGDLVDVIGVLGQYTNFQLRVVDKAHVTKSLDKYGPVISITNLEEVLTGKDYRVIAVITDSTGVKEVKLSYIADGVTTKAVIMTAKVAGQYEYTIPAAELTGTNLSLEITASDQMEPANTSTVKVEKPIINLPRIVNVTPEDGSSTGEGANKPTIIAVLENAGENPTFDLKLDSVAVEPVVTKLNEYNIVTYNTLTALSEGDHTVTITVTRQDTKSVTYSWSFHVGRIDYNTYFGQIHSHTTLSDGAGEVEDAFAYAAKTANNIDFLAITDHSNSLEDVAGTNNIANATNSAKWLRGKKAAADITAEVDDFVGIYAYEMTWSGGSIGHMNTYNTPGFENRNNAKFKTTTALKTYFDALKTQPGSISMYNHPGDTFGDFGDFSYYDTEIDKLVTLIEVGNGEGDVGGSGYFPSYEYYTRALDKGWHLAPTNNQDNHKGKWGDANTARTVVLATELTEEGIYDAMRNMRVYASEDNNLNIIYTLNNNIMGSILEDSTEPIHISVEIKDPDSEPIGTVEIVVNGGMVAAKKEVTASNETVEFTLPDDYSYYYIRIIQTDEHIEVTDLVWVGEVEKCGISNSVVNKELALKGEEIEISTSYFNNESLPLVINKLEYSIDGNIIKTITGLDAVASLGQGKAVFQYTSLTAGSVNLNVKLFSTLDGVEKVFTDVVKIVFHDPNIVTRVLIDGTHFNDYVYGYYSGNMTNFTKLAAKEMTQVEVITDKAKLTPAALSEAELLIITVPARWAGYLNYASIPTVVSPFSNEYIAMIKEYVDKGGNVIICGISDREDRQDGVGTQASTQINKLLAGIGSTTRINSDEGTDFTTNSGQEYRLHFNNFNMASEFLEGVVVSQRYSMYKGCSLLLDPIAVAAGKVEWLVKGHSTTETKDIRAYDTNYVPQTKGNVVVLASEKLSGGGFMLVGGSVFMSNFEVQAELDNFSDLQYTNYNIILNAVKKAKKELVITPITDVRKGTKGEVYTVEGIVTAGTEAGNAFFDTIYIQDNTGGINIFPVNEQGIKLGQKVKVTGTLAEYENDLELTVITVAVTDNDIHLIEPVLVTTADAADYAASGGKLIKINGVVTRVEKVEGVVSYFMVKDSSGVPIRVFINGYIGSHTGVDPTTKLAVGDTVTAVGLSSMDTEGVRIRVRDRAEIIVTSAPPITPGPDPTGTPTTGPTITPVPVVTPIPTRIITIEQGRLQVSIDMLLEDFTDTTKKVIIPIIKDELLKQIANSEIQNFNIIIKLPDDALLNPKAKLCIEAWVFKFVKSFKMNLMISIVDKAGKERYTWNLYAKDLINSKNEPTDVNLFLYVNDVNNHEELKKTLGVGNELQGLVISFGHIGILQSRFNVRIYVGDQEGMTPGRTIFLYYFNPITGRLETLPYSTYRVDKDGYIIIHILHCSDYVILPVQAAANQITSLLSQITIAPREKTLYVGESTSIKVELPTTLELIGALTDKPSQTAVGGVVITYQSDNKKVATVNKEGQITAKGVGTCNIITTITLYSGKTKVITTSITIKEPYITLDNSVSSMKQGDTFTFAAAAYGLDPDSILWTTTRKSILVIDKKTGKATAKSTGTDYVVASIGNVSVKVKVVVKK